MGCCLPLLYIHVIKSRGILLSGLDPIINQLRQLQRTYPSLLYAEIIEHHAKWVDSYRR